MIEILREYDISPFKIILPYLAKRNRALAISLTR